MRRTGRGSATAGHESAASLQKSLRGLSTFCLKARRALSEGAPADCLVYWLVCRRDLLGLPKAVAASRLVHSGVAPALPWPFARAVGGVDRPEQVRHRVLLRSWRGIAVRACTKFRRSDRALPAAACDRPIAGLCGPATPEAPYRRPALKLRGAPAIKSSSRSGRARVGCGRSGRRGPTRAPCARRASSSRATVRLCLSALRLVAAPPPIRFERERS